MTEGPSSLNRDADPPGSDFARLSAATRALAQRVSVDVRSSVSRLDEIAGALAAKSEVRAAEHAIRDVLHGLDLMRVELENLLKGLESAEAARVRRERYGPRWISEMQAKLRSGFAVDPEATARQWLAASAELLGAWELKNVASLAEENFSLPESFPHLTLLREGVSAIRDGRYPDAVPLLQFFLTGSVPDDPWRPEYDTSTRIALFVLLARIYLLEFDPSDPGIAHQVLEQAASVGPQDGRVDAAFSDYAREEGDATQALAYAQQAVDKAPSIPGSYIAMGWYFEHEEVWDSAVEMYKRAAELAAKESDPLTGFGRLLAPVSGLAWLILGQLLQEVAPDKALAAAEQALERGVNGPDEYPDHAVYSLRAKLLDCTKHASEAGEAYYQAGRRLYWSRDFARARDLLERAIALRSDLIDGYWCLADTLLLLSYTENFSDDTIDAAEKVWERGRSLRPPESNDSWAYVTRGLISERRGEISPTNRWSNLWNAVSWIEQALLWEPGRARWWAYLGRNYRQLYAESNSLSATLRAIELSPDDKTALEERAAILANRGEFEQALELINQRLALGGDAWGNYVKAYILNGLGRHLEALEQIDLAVASEPAKLSYRRQRATVLRYLKRNQDYLSELNVIWEFREKPDYKADVYLFANTCLELAMATGNKDYFREVITLSNALSKERPGAVETFDMLGIAHLASGDIEQGRKAVEETVRLATNKGQIQDVLEDLGRVAKMVPPEAIAQLREYANAQITKLEEPKLPDAELQDFLSYEKAGSLAWVGINASLARLHAGHSRGLDAARIYQTLLNEKSLFPAAEIGLRKSLDGGSSR